MITIVDYKVGNLGSIQNMLKKIGAKSEITSDPSKIKSATKVILPGVGAYDSGIESLKKYNLWDILNEKALVEQVPILGICLGAQLLCTKSEEGELDGFGWINAEVRRFEFKDKMLKVPHIGWNYTSLQKDSKLFKGMYQDPKFYFVHSFYMDVNDNSGLTKTTYSFEFDSAVEKENIMGVQFHPEKSHKFGMKLLENFVREY
ncbi:imidazole glycerol phosphate synthase subunit HisH [Aquimarina sp. AD10]|uniref:imidazole glycerol phosphate synthase subunit HisH n=1 Tax=Aquimarina sp. AD10 TaxID=1714849 RepID=UPI000E4CDB33|nr:imidazole glycerol phosphate synthase subunit HisH [Aquimarina sp. AD10]AXT63693.1 imidazole glycerol phosphate synthase subunit HisH [Aquimarina sp. AD10]RKN02683.1 imidazole glycerol phosphate synthase subunit HisH [Aquimarina sp. AD10]